MLFFKLTSYVAEEEERQGAVRSCCGGDRRHLGFLKNVERERVESPRARFKGLVHLSLEELARFNWCAAERTSSSAIDIVALSSSLVLVSVAAGAVAVEILLTLTQAAQWSDSETKALFR